MKFTATSCIALLISGALVSGCGQASNVLEMDKIKGVMGMTKTQVKEVLGTPESASDISFSYKTIQPDTGKQTTCDVWFQGGPTVSSIDC